MADVRPFRGLRYNPAAADPALTIAPPYDVISRDQQAALYTRSPYNIVRVEFAEPRPDDSARDNRYTRASRDLISWLRAGILVRDDTPAMYAYTLEFEREGRRYVRHHVFCVVRLEEWEKGAVKPHERTLSGPKADRLELLRATATQVSPVYGLVRDAGTFASLRGEQLYDFTSDGQRHTLSAVADDGVLRVLSDLLAGRDIYIADGHHRYETALAYRDERRAKAPRWTGAEPENFVLMALSDATDPGLLVLPTHRLVNPPHFAIGQVERLHDWFDVEDVSSAWNSDDAFDDALALLGAAGDTTRFLALGLRPGQAHMLTLREPAALAALMPGDQSEAWKRLDVNVLEYGILRAVFGIDDAALAAGQVVSYTQDTRAARDALASGDARHAFLLNATPVAQVLAIADAGGVMPQKSTYFYPKLPTGLVMNALA